RAPESSSIEEYSRFMKDNGVTDVFCFCDPEYYINFFANNDIKYHNLEFPERSTPSPQRLEKFDTMIDSAFNRAFEKAFEKQKYMFKKNSRGSTSGNQRPLIQKNYQLTIQGNPHESSPGNPQESSEKFT